LRAVSGLREPYRVRQRMAQSLVESSFRFENGRFCCKMVRASLVISILGDKGKEKRRKKRRVTWWKIRYGERCLTRRCVKGRGEVNIMMKGQSLSHSPTPQHPVLSLFLIKFSL